jgi:hypothetical protein
MPRPSHVMPVTVGAQGAGAPRATRFRLASPITAVVVAVVTAVLVAAVEALSLLNHDPQANLASNMPLVGIALAFAAVGFVVARQQPHNAIGWILLASAQCILLSEVGTTYSVIDYRLHQGSPPLGWVAVSIGMFWRYVLAPLAHADGVTHPALPRGEAALAALALVAVGLRDRGGNGNHLNAGGRSPYRPRAARSHSLGR